MSALTAWYRSHWNRGLGDETTRAMATAAAGVTFSLSTPSDSNNRDVASTKNKYDSLFGPNIGIVSSGPKWTDINEKKVLTDELTPEVVKSWIAKSKEPTQPTTTLQALVNLKRPTIRLSPLTPTATADDIAPADPHHHGLEFEYDCDAPKCSIHVHVLLSPSHPAAAAAAAATHGKHSRILVFESVVEGGFGMTLTIDEGASLELGRFEHSTLPRASLPVTTATTSGLNANVSTASIGDPTPPSESTPTSTMLEPPAGRGDRRRRFSNFPFRKNRMHAVSGPALVVVDAATPAEAAASAGNAGAKEEGDRDEGVRVIIRLVALDEHGTELASPNEQVTYLHVVRFGPAPAENEEDGRPWVVKVVKREATIGPHTFHLHEIYGLSSAPSHAAPTATPATPARVLPSVLPTLPTPLTSLPTPSSATPFLAHTYPPAAAPNAAAPEVEPSSECLVCLSSPREVVLLPCRHLVACKDCALNMVEFGAGGSIVQPEAAAGDGADAGAGAEGGAAAAVAPAPQLTAANTRRKRKAKGWFCPVCRQPYTSLLRITTTPPSKDDEEEEDEKEKEKEHEQDCANGHDHESGDIDDDENRGSTSSGAAGLPLPVTSPGAEGDAAEGGAPRGGLSAFKPTFLKGLSRGKSVPDLERGVA